MATPNDLTAKGSLATESPSCSGELQIGDHKQWFYQNHFGDAFIPGPRK